MTEPPSPTPHLPVEPATRSVERIFSAADDESITAGPDETTEGVVTGGRIALGAATYFGVRCLGALMGAVVIVIMTRSLSREEFGAFSLALTLVSLGAVISDTGINAVLSRETIARPELEASLVRWSMLLRVLTGSVAAAACFSVAVLARNSGDALLTIALVLATLPLLGFTVGMNALSRRFLLNRVSALLFVQSALWLACVVFLATRDAALPAYGWLYLLSTIGFGALVLASSRRVYTSGGYSLDWRGAWRHLRQALPLGLNGILVLAYAKLDAVLLYGMKGAAQTAPYALAYRFLDQFGILPMTLATVFSPLANYHLREGMPLDGVFQRWLRLSLVGSVAVVIWAIAYSSALVTAIGGSAYADGAVLLQLLAPSFTLICVGFVLTGTAVAINVAGRQLMISACLLVFNVGGNLLLIPSWGGRAAAIMTVSTEALVVSGIFLAIRAKAQVRFPDLRVVGKLAVLTGAGTLCVWWLPFIPGSVLLVPVWLVGAYALGLITRADIHTRVPRRATQ